MGAIVGAAAGIILFAVFGFLPAFRFGSYLALFILQKAAGKSVEPSAWARFFIVSSALVSILMGAAFFTVIGSLIGTVLLF
jgi:hypothetical protein